MLFDRQSFLGVPLAFLIAITPPAILSNSSYNAGVNAWYSVRDSVVANPSALVTQDSVEAAQALHAEMERAYQYARWWAIVGAIALVFSFTLTLFVGSKLLWRARKELLARRQEASTKTRPEIAAMELQSRSPESRVCSDIVPPSSVRGRGEKLGSKKFETSRARFVQYLAGCRPLTGDEEEEIAQERKGGIECGYQKHQKSTSSVSEILSDGQVVDILGK